MADVEVLPVGLDTIFVYGCLFLLSYRFLRKLFIGNYQSPVPLSVQDLSPSEIEEFINPDNRDLREKLWNVFRDPLYTPRYDMSLSQEREIAYQRLKKVCEQNLISVQDFATDPRKIFIAHEIAGSVDGSMATKMTVQFNLFGGTVFKLGTAFHRDLLVKGIDSFTDPGCFALTELGYGNNAVEMETTATFDKERDCFVINTPSTLAQKYWITNGAVHAKWSVVFARLRLPTEAGDYADEGVHGFLVNIRDDDLKEKEGCTVQDMGYKIGVNGVDNARLWFDNVVVPRSHMLDATSQVDREGKITCPIRSKRGRFLAMADQLLSGRICIAAMCLGGVKQSILISLNYASTRMAVGPDGKSSANLLSFQLQQRALLPLLATTYAMHFALTDVKDMYARVTTSETKDPAESAELLRRICGLKALATWHSERGASICRERCGGQGFLSVNRFLEQIGGAHAGITAEGDNCVLMQKVAKELLPSLKKPEIVKHILLSYFPAFVGSFTDGLFCGSPTGMACQLKLFQIRAQRLLRVLGFQVFMFTKKKGMSLYDAWVKHLQDDVQHLARAWTENVILESFHQWVCKAEREAPKVAAVLRPLFSLYACSRLEADMAYFLQEGLLSAADATLVQKESQRLCRELTPAAVNLASGFGLPEELCFAPIARDWESYNVKENDNQGEHEASKFLFV